MQSSVGNIIVWDSSTNTGSISSPTKGDTSANESHESVTYYGMSEESKAALSLLNSKPHSQFMRSLTTRLSQLRELNEIWSGKPSFRTLSRKTQRLAITSGENYMNALQHAYNSLHEWTAVDFLRNLNCLDTTLETSPSRYHPDDVNVVTTTVEGGIPVWSYPDSINLSWIRYLFPIICTLLHSPFEDYVFVALEALWHIVKAMEPLIAESEGLEINALVDSVQDKASDISIDSIKDVSLDEDGNVSTQLDNDSSNSPSRESITARSGILYVSALYPLIDILSRLSASPSKAVTRVSSSRQHELLDHIQRLSHLVDASRKLYL